VSPDRLVARLSFPNVVQPRSGVTGIVRRVASDVPPALAFAILSGGLVASGLLGARRTLRPAWQRGTAVLTGASILASVAGCGGGIAGSRRSLDAAEKRLYFHQGLAAGPTLISGSGGARRVLRRRDGERVGGSGRRRPLRRRGPVGLRPMTSI
jgi:hypothetical protein